MTRVLRATEIIGRPVITLDTATAIGEIRDVLVDPSRARIIGFTLRGRGLLSPGLLGILPVEWVHGLGHDAVIVPSAASLVTDREGMSDALGEQKDVIGKEVVTDTGSSLGTVTDVVIEVDGADASVVGYEIDRTDARPFIVPADDRAAISDEALVLPADAERRAAAGLAEFRESRERDHSGHVPAGT